MAEVRLPAPVKATEDPRLSEPSWAEGTKFMPGAYHYSKERGERVWYCCPCGCGSISGLKVHLLGTPAPVPKQEPTWSWNPKTVTMAPSIHHIGHWHGHLRDGFYVDA